MIEYLWGRWVELWYEWVEFLSLNFDPVRDLLDIAIIAFAVYWMLLLIKGTRAVQVLVGVMALIAVKLVSDLLNLGTISWVLDNFAGYAFLIVIILFQADVRRALARVGRGVFPRIAEHQEGRILEEVVRAAATLAQKRVGALIVLERETGLEDQIEAGTPLDALVSKDLLTALFLPYSPLHDGAAVIANGHVTHAGCILPLTLKTELPEGVGTRHRAAVGITEETDAVVVVVSEETGRISVVVGGELIQDLDGPELRGTLRNLFLRDAGAEEDEDSEEAEAGSEAEEGRPVEGAAG